MAAYGRLVVMQAAAPDREQDVPLVQFAAINAAVAEQFPLEDVLALEGVSKTEWFEAEVKWKVRVAEDDQMLERYLVALSEQQDRLSRRVRPLDDDLEAWATFLHLYRVDVDAFDLLALQGLRMSDLARLQRLWTFKLEMSTLLAERASRHATRLAKRRDVRLPSITITPAVLTASPAAREGGSSEAYLQDADVGARELLGLDRFASLAVRLEFSPDEAKEIRQRYGLNTGEYQAVEAAWDLRLDRNTELSADFRALKSHYRHRNRLRSNAPARPVPPASPMATTLTPPARAPIDTTADEIPALRDSEPLPFGEVDSRQVERFVIAFPPIDTSAAEPVPEAGSTGAEIPALRDSTPLPFQQDELNATSFITGLRLDLDEAPSTSHPLPPSLPELTLAQYASLQAELDVSVESRATILAKYHVTDESQYSWLERLWSLHCANDRAANEEYEKRRRDYVAWLDRRRERSR